LLLSFDCNILFAQIKMRLILTTTVMLPAQGVQRTTPIKIYRMSEPKK